MRTRNYKKRNIFKSQKITSAVSIDYRHARYDAAYRARVAFNEIKCQELLACQQLMRAQYIIYFFAADSSITQVLCCREVF